MSIITIVESGSKSLDRAAKVLAGIPDGFQKATQSAAHRAMSTLKSDAGKAVRERYDISQGNAMNDATISISYSYGSGTRVEATFLGSKIPLYKYGGASPKAPQYDTSRLIPIMIGGQWRMAHPGTPAFGHQLTSTGPVRFNHAFTARMSSGHVGIFEKDGGATSGGGDSISEIMGSSLPQMVGHDEVTEKLEKPVREKFEERLDHEISRILAGFGM